MLRVVGRVADVVGAQAESGVCQAMTLRNLADALADEAAEPVRRRLILEFLDGWQWEPPEIRLRLL